MSRVGQPRWAVDNRMVVPSKPVPTIKKKDTRHGPARPEKIEEMLNDQLGFLQQGHAPVGRRWLDF